MMDFIFIKILIAHFLGDFLLQPNSWVEEKERRKLKSLKLYLHVAIHVVLIFLISGTFAVWPIALIIGVSHFLIDAAKLVYQKPTTKRSWFFVDQLLHIFVIFVCTYNFQIFDFSFVNDQRFWWCVLGAVFLTSPAAILIRMLIARFIPNKNAITLQNAGKFIGILERLLIFVFVLTGHFEAVGFLLAAKSIFRFGDLKEANEVRLTEYVLIGTLLSFGIAVITALTVNQLLLN